MALYEHLLIARQDISAQQVDALATHLKTIVEGEGGKIEKQEYWGLRGLAYRIKKNRKGHYVLLNINAPATAVIELERQLKINEDVLRYITVKVDQFDISSNKNRRDDRAEKTEGETEETVQGALVETVKAANAAVIASAVATGKAAAVPAMMAPAAPSSAARRPALSPAITRPRSTIRTSSFCSASFPSAARSCRPASPRSATRSSAFWPTPSSAPASWRCCPMS